MSLLLFGVCLRAEVKETSLRGLTEHSVGNQYSPRLAGHCPSVPRQPLSHLFSRASFLTVPGHKQANQVLTALAVVWLLFFQVLPTLTMADRDYEASGCLALSP